MPPLRKLRIGALEDLAQQLRFAPAETSRRQLERAEQLAAEVDPKVNYPEDWVVFRVTGYRPQMDAPAIVVGEALLGDISVLVEQLSAAAGIAEKDLPAGKYIDSAALQSRWNVSRKTLDRYRLRGLIARRVASEHSVSRLMFPLDSVERFEKQWGESIKTAAEYSRIGTGLEEKMIRRARVYHDRFGCTLNQAAKRLADRFERAHETVRQILRRHDAGSKEPIFAEAGPPTKRDRALVERAWWWGVEPGRIADHLKRSSASVQRVIVDVRAARLQALKLDVVAVEADKALASPHCTTGLGAAGNVDVAVWLAEAREAQPPAQAAEKARAIGYHALRARAAGAIASLVRHGNSATVVDRIETDLRWAARLKAELVRSQFSLIVRSLENAIGRPLEELRGPVLVELIAASIAAVAEAVDEFHAAKGGRLASPAGFAMTRIATGFARNAAAKLEVGRPRAVGRLASGLMMVDWTRRVAAWQSYQGSLWLEPHRSVREGLGSLQARARKLMELRYGWGGGAPRTIAEAAVEIGLPAVRAAALERRVLGARRKALP